MRFFRRPSRVTRPSALTTAQPFTQYALRQPRRGAPFVTAETMMSLPPFYAAMRVCAGVVADLPILDADDKPIDVMPMSGTHLLAHPTEHDTCFTFLDSVMWNLLIHANCFVVPTRVDMATGAISMVEVVHPDYVVPLWNRSGSEASFEIGCWIDGEQYGPSDFIHLKEVTEGGRAWGLSKLKLLSHAIGLQLSEQAHVKGTYDDGAQPTGYFTTDKPMDPTVAAEYAATLGLQVGGRGSAVQVLPDGLKWESVTLNHQDIQLLAARQWSTAQAASIIGVPPHLIGAATYDSETYSNARMDMAVFEALTLCRYKRVISEAFNLHGIDFRFGSANLAQPTMGEQVTAVVAAVTAGLCSPAQGAERLGWPEPDTPAVPLRRPATAPTATAAGRWTTN